MHALAPEALEQVAEFFQALSEPSRLRLLNLLREGERKVGELAELAGSTPANVSRHMALLQSRGLVTREGRGNCVYYAIADPAWLIERLNHLKGLQSNETLEAWRALIAAGDFAALVEELEGSLEVATPTNIHMKMNLIFLINMLVAVG